MRHIIATFLALFVTLLAFSAPAADGLQLLGETSLVVDPACNAVAEARLQLVLSNTAKTGEELPLALRAEHLVLDGAGTLPSATVTIETPTGSSLPSALGPGASTTFVVLAKGWLGPGKWNADLYNGAALLGTAHFLVADRLAHLKPLGAESNQIALTLTKGQTTSLVLANADPTVYSVTGTFWLKDNPTPAIIGADGGIPVNETAMLPLEPLKEWFRDTSTFYDATANGYLRVQLRPTPGCEPAPQPPAKVFPVAVTLVGYSQSMKSWCTYSATILMLVLGAIFSLFVNYKLPDDRIRRDLRKRLGDVRAPIEALPKELASTLRVAAGVDRKSLRAQLCLLAWWSTDFETKRARIDDSVAKLVSRVDVLARMAQLRARYESMSPCNVPPSLLDQLEGLFDRTTQLLAVLEPPDARVNAAVANLDEIERTVGSWSDIKITPPQDMPLATQIAGRLASLSHDLQQNGRLVNVQDWNDLVAEVPGLDVLNVRPLAATDLQPDAYVEQDWLGVIGTLLREYCLIHVQRRPAADDPIRTRRAELVTLLQKRTWTSLKAARRLVAEMTARIYAENIRDAIATKHAKIVLDNSQLRSLEPGWFGIEFENANYNGTAARAEWVPEWNFGHVPAGYQNEEKFYLREEGWRVAHYFPDKRSYTVTVSFRPADGTNAPHALKLEKEISVGAATDGEAEGQSARPSSRTWRWLKSSFGDAARVAIALIPVILALFSGAKEQLLKLGPGLGLITVFGIGFCADQVKALLSKSK